MAKVLTFGIDSQTLNDFAEHHSDVEESIRLYYLTAPAERFFYYLPIEIEAEFRKRLDEQEKQGCLTVLAHLEALWRTDFHLRCTNKAKDPLSRHLRQLLRTKGKRVSFEDDLLSAWVALSPMPKKLASEIKAAFKFRHWLAHGRHWEPDLGRKFDYPYVYQLALACKPYFKFS